MTLVAGLNAARLKAQPLPEPHPRPERDPAYARVKLDSGLGSYAPVGALSGQVLGAHQDILGWLTAAWAAGFTKIYPEVEFTLRLEDPRVAVPGLMPGAAQFVVPGREMLDPDREAFHRKQGVEYDPFRIAVAGATYRTMGYTETFVFFVNKANPIDRLSLAQLDAMYSTTRNRRYKEDIRTWGQLGLTGEWADRPIVLMGVTAPNGYEAFLRERVLKDGKVKSGIDTRDTVFPLPYLVGFAPGAVGYAGLSFLTPCAKQIKPIAVADEDGGPYYAGTLDEVLARKYPLSRLVYLYTHRIPGRPLDPRLKEFLRFILSRDGQQIVVDDGVYLPLPAWFAERELARLE
jgi:phosphate transport system substrate-binding protein